MKLFITTQYMENYSDDPVNSPYWKMKGGVDYFLRLGDKVNYDALESLVLQLTDKLEYSNDFAQEHVIDWSVEADDYLTWFEQSQLEYEGKIYHHATEVTL